MLSINAELRKTCVCGCTMKILFKGLSTLFTMAISGNERKHFSHVTPHVCTHVSRPSVFQVTLIYKQSLYRTCVVPEEPKEENCERAER